MWYKNYTPEYREEDQKYTPEYWEDRMYSHEECCSTCRYFYWQNCQIVDEFDMPSPDGSDCCDRWEGRRGSRL